MVVVVAFRVGELVQRAASPSSASSAGRLLEGQPGRKPAGRPETPAAIARQAVSTERARTGRRPQSGSSWQEGLRSGANLLPPWRGPQLGGFQLIAFALPGLLGGNVHGFAPLAGERKPSLQLHCPVGGRATALGCFNDHALNASAEV